VSAPTATLALRVGVLSALLATDLGDLLLDHADERRDPRIADVLRQMDQRLAGLLGIEDAEPARRHALSVDRALPIEAAGRAVREARDSTADGTPQEKLEALYQAMDAPYGPAGSVD